MHVFVPPALARSHPPFLGPWRLAFHGGPQPPCGMWPSEGSLWSGPELARPVVSHTRRSLRFPQGDGRQPSAHARTPQGIALARRAW